MTAIKNGIKCTLRTPWKTLLFSVVLILIAALLTVSLCAYTAVRKYLKDCDDYFHTIANLEYVGDNYPDSSVYDPDLVKAVSEHEEELGALLQAKEVISFETESNTVALIDGMHRWDVYVRDPNFAVLSLKCRLYDDQLDIYMMMVTETFYSGRDYNNTLLFVRTDAMPSNGGEKLESGKTYYAAGRFFKGQTANPWFFAEGATFYEDGETVILPPFTPTDADESLLAAYIRYADVTTLKNDCCRVYYSSSLDDYPPFQQQMLSLISGRLFTQEEYDSKAHVCVVSERITQMMNVHLGDRLSMSVFSSPEDLYEPGKWEASDEGDYEIVGIYKDTDQFMYRVFLPDADATDSGIRPVTGCRLGHFRLQNDKADSFEQLAKPLEDAGFRVTVYDQGYEAATEPMRELLFISIIFLAVCLLLAVAAHALQSHLFVSRQKESALTMRALGTAPAHVVLYFISAALMLSVVSVVIGCVIGKLLEGRVMDALRRFATQFADKDLRFSGSRISLSRTLDFEPSIPLSVYLLSAVLLIAGSVLFTAVFALRNLREEKTRTRKRPLLFQTKKKRAGKSSKLSGVLKYALLSMRRGVVRTAAVILLCLIVAIFFGRLTTSLDGYRAQLQTYRENAVITGFATDYKGQLIDGLVVRNKPVANLVATGLLSDYTITDTVAYCEPLGISESADGEVHEVTIPRMPSLGSFAFDTLIDRLHSKSRWIAASSVNGSPIFHYVKVKTIRWLEGYSDDDFAGDGKICALPESMMEEQGIALGDTVRFLFVDTGYFTFQVAGTADVKVVAAYAADISKSYVFSPINYHPSLEILNQEYEQYHFGYSSDSLAVRTYDSFLFTLGDSDKLQELRQALDDSGFTYVHSGNRSRPYAIIEDEIFLSTTHSMERQIQYVGVLYDALYVIAGVIGAVLAWLIALSRRREIALLRAMGTQPYRILLNFVFEQIVLSTAGVLLGVGLSFLLGSTLSPTFLILSGAFWVIWNLSTLICVIAALVKPSYASLTEPE